MARQPELAVQFDSLEQQEHAARLGMWLFLGSEVLLFAGFFGLYAAYRTMHGAAFVEGVQHNALFIGSFNTLVLITSSLTVAMSLHFMRAGSRRRSLAMLGATLGLGATFLVIKWIEYADHFAHGIFPGRYYHFDELPTYGAQTFYTLYFLMTGTHALHVIAGMSVLTWCVVVILREGWTSEHHVGLELSALYWHLVDVIWIFLWPLLYLTR
jgi:cytochrome c oxidase subunit 3